MNLNREDVINAFKFILGRNPESEEIINNHRNLPSIDYLRKALFDSSEFDKEVTLLNHKDRWVIAPIREGLKIWINLADQHVSRGILYDNWEKPETEFILGQLTPDMVFLDIGANLGWFSTLAAMLCRTVFSFEANPKIASYLSDTLTELNPKLTIRDIRVYNVGLSDEKGKAFIKYAKNLYNIGGGHLASEIKDGDTEHYYHPVNLETLDSYGTNPGLIKIDVEGAEYKVFKGAEETLKKYNPVIMSEYLPKQLEKVSDCSGRDYLELMKSFGYNIYTLNGQKFDETTKVDNPINLVFSHE